MAQRRDWQTMGFGRQPEQRVAPAGGLVLYRAWGASSSELGTGYFSLEKPVSVLDAELRFNIADWGNGVHFVSTFRLMEGFPYLVGPVAHGQGDLSRLGTQVFLEPFILTRVRIEASREVLRHDVFVSHRAANA